MKTIIKKGTKNTRECNACGCLFSFDEEDICCGLIFSPRYVKCPQCDRPVDLASLMPLEKEHQTIKLTGKFLNFNEEFGDFRHVIPDTCDIDFPDEVPVYFQFDYDKSIGKAKVERRVDGLYCDVELYSPDESLTNGLNSMLDNLNGIGCGGYYNHIVDHKNKDGFKIVDSCILAKISLTYGPVSDSHRLYLVKEV